MTDTEAVNKNVAKTAIEPITAREMCRQMPHVFRVDSQLMGEKAAGLSIFQTAVARLFK